MKKLLVSLGAALCLLVAVAIGAPHGTASADVGTNIGVGSFNILGASHTEPGADAAQKGYASYDKRAPAEMDAIKKSGVAVVGLQEVNNVQLSVFKDLLGDDWKLYHQGVPENTIAWNSTVLKKIDAGTISYPWYNKDINATWVHFKQVTTGQEFIFTDMHAVLAGYGGHDDASVAFYSAKRHDGIVTVAKKWNDFATQYPGIPMFLTGDMNADFNKFFCTFSGTVKQGAISADGATGNSDGCKKGSKENCTSKDGNVIGAMGSPCIDWIVGIDGAGISFSHWKVIDSATNTMGSDHKYVTATVTFGQASGSYDMSGDGDTDVDGFSNGLNIDPGQHIADPEIANCEKAGCDFVKNYINPIIVTLSILVGLAVTIGIIWGGVQISMAAGDPQKVMDGRRHIVSAVIALVSFILFYAFLNWILPGGVNP